MDMKKLESALHFTTLLEVILYKEIALQYIQHKYKLL